MTLTEKAGHLAWCALVALALARQDNAGVLSPVQESIFLNRWLASALKQRRFPREINQDIEWLLKQGRLLGANAKLVNKLNYLWHSCTGDLSEQNDLFRLTYALDTARDMNWSYRLLNDREWSGGYEVKLNAGTNAIYLSRSNLDASFDENGSQVNPLLMRLTGNITGLIKLFNHCGWEVEPEQDMSMPYCYVLMARTSVP